jgi:hypothetical protein
LIKNETDDTDNIFEDNELNNKHNRKSDTSHDKYRAQKRDKVNPCNSLVSTKTGFALVLIFHAD